MTHFRTRLASVGARVAARSRASHFAACALSFTLALSASRARANGRFPNAEQLREVAPGQIVVSGTYGLLVSGNSTDFEFVCESALFGKSLMGSWVDPLLETLPDGTILSGSLNGLRVSRDRGCSFASDWSLPYDPTFIPPDPSAAGKTGTVVDLCPAYDATQGAIALTSITNSDSTTLQYQLFHTTDDAATWSTLGMPIPTSMVHVVFTVDVAPSDPTHVYVSGNLTGENFLIASEDSGVTWTPHEITVADSAGVQGLYVAAVSPTDPKRVYLRVSRQSQADDGSTTWDDSLLVTDDEGATSRDVLRERGALLGFALSPDGKTVLAGFGDPVVAPTVVDDSAVGLYSASSDDLTFTQKIPNFYPSCLRWTSDALYACAKESDPLGLTAGETDFHVGVYPGGGVPSALSDFTVLAKLKDVRGPLPLASGLPSSCETEWTTADPTSPGVTSVCATLNACPGDAGTVALSPGAIVCGEPGDGGSAAGSSSSTSGGQSASGGSGGRSGAGGASGTVSGGGTTAGASHGSSNGANGCSCRAAGGERESGAIFGLFLGLGFALWRRVRGAS